MSSATIANLTHKALYTIMAFGGLGSGVLTCLIFWKLHDNRERHMTRSLKG